MSLPLRLTARRRVGPVLLACAALACGARSAVAAGPNLPVTPEWRATAQQVAQAGVPLSELSPNAPDSYTVQRGDTLWDISKLFLTTPWRWPERANCNRCAPLDPGQWVWRCLPCSLVWAVGVS